MEAQPVGFSTDDPLNPHQKLASTSPPAKVKRKPAKRREHLRSGLILPKQPSQLAKNASEKANEFRRELEDACLLAHGEISKPMMGLILTATVWYRHFLHVSQRMRTDYAQLSAREWLEFSKAACYASNERDRCVKALGLDARHSLFDLPPLEAMSDE